MGKTSTKQMKKFLKEMAKERKKGGRAKTTAKTKFLYNPWVLKITGGIVTALILYFLLGK